MQFTHLECEKSSSVFVFCEHQIYSRLEALRNPKLKKIRTGVSSGGKLKVGPRWPLSPASGAYHRWPRSTPPLYRWLEDAPAAPPLPPPAADKERAPAPCLSRPVSSDGLAPGDTTHIVSTPVWVTEEVGGGHVYLCKLPGCVTSPP